jgi:Protein of unknown function (DUF3313)
MAKRKHGTRGWMRSRGSLPERERPDGASVIAAVVAALVVVAGCVSTNQARSVKPSGFLGDSAALLKKGGKSDFLLVYRNKDADWKAYDKIIVEPITLWGIENSKLPSDQLADFQKLVDQFYAMLKAKLSKDYTLTDTAAAGVMRVQIAIIDGERANAPLKVATTIAPYAGYADTLWTFATGKPAFAGEVSLEYMVKDSQSQELLAAGADRRVGGNQWGESTLSSWGDVQNSLIYWTDEAVYRLCLDRGEKDCPEPKAGILKNPLM